MVRVIWTDHCSYEIEDGASFVLFSSGIGWGFLQYGVQDCLLGGILGLIIPTVLYLATRHHQIPSMAQGDILLMGAAGAWVGIKVFPLVLIALPFLGTLQVIFLRTRKIPLAPPLLLTSAFFLFLRFFDSSWIKLF